MNSDREIFSLSGPTHLTSVDWRNADHRRSVAASLVQGVYLLERDRHENRTGILSLAPPWFEFFNFQIYSLLVDDADNSIFGAIYQLNPAAATNGSPRYVIALRGTITKGGAFSRDLELDIHFIKNGLHRTSRFELAMQAVRNTVAGFGHSDTWIAGHSLGAAMAMLAGKTMAKIGIFLEAFLFNSPFLSAPIESIKDKKVKHGIRFASSVITAGLAFAVKGADQHRRSEDTFAMLYAWTPGLYVHPADHLCSEYIGYFEHRERMEEIGAGGIERLATLHSLEGLFMNAIGKVSEEPLHLIPSANLTINLTPSPDFKGAHGIHQWWSPDLNLKSKLYQYR